MKRINKLPRKAANPEFIGKTYDCPTCGGAFTVIRRTAVGLVGDGKTPNKSVTTHCPYCGDLVILDSDPHKQLRDKLTKFILSQVAPIKAIEDENIRLPMQKLLDDFYKLVQED